MKTNNEKDMCADSILGDYNTFGNNFSLTLNLLCGRKIKNKDLGVELHIFYKRNLLMSPLHYSTFLHVKLHLFE